MKYKAKKIDHSSKYQELVDEANKEIEKYRYEKMKALVKAKDFFVL